MNGDRPLLGIGLMLGFCVLVPLSDAMAKLLTQGWPLLLLVFARFCIQTAVLLPLAAVLGLPLRLSRRAWWLTAARTALHVTAMGLLFAALRVMPLADAIAIIFVMPFILLLLGRVFLGEEVGHRRLIACAAGFVGTLMVVQPSFAEVGAAAFLPLGVALLFAVFMLITRQVAREADPIVLQGISGGVATLALLGPVLWLHDGIPVGAGAVDLWLLLGMGLIGALAHLLMTWSLRFAPSATLAPMQYLEIPFATAIGWLVFRDFPDGLALLGIAVTVVSGLYIIARERRLGRAPAPRSLPPAPPAAE